MVAMEFLILDLLERDIHKTAWKEWDWNTTEVE